MKTFVAAALLAVSASALAADAVEPTDDPETGLSNREQTVLTSLLVVQFARQAKAEDTLGSNSVEETPNADDEDCGNGASILTRIRCWFGSHFQ